MITIQLQPFAATPPADALRIEVQATRRASQVQLEYRCTGALNAWILPPPHPTPRRRDALWEHTCFEAFIAWGDSTGYLELNAAPSGDFQLYALDGYRVGLRPELRLAPPQVSSRRASAELWVLQATVDLSPLVAPDSQLALRLGLTAVLEDQSHALSFWAAAHPGPKPDFHRADSFVVRL